MKQPTETNPTVWLCIAIAMVVVASPVAAEAGWTLFRGDPAMSGKATTAGPTANELAPVWMFEADDGFEGAVAVDAVGNVYAGALDGHLYAIDAAGKLRWKYKGGYEIKSSPALAGDTVFIGDGDGVFHAVDAATGKARWTFTTESEIVSSPNVVGDRVLFGSHDETLYCLSARDGSLLWKVKTEGYVYGSPAVIDGTVVSAGCDGILRVIDLESGKVLKSIEIGSYVGATPAIRGRHVYFGTYDNEVLAVSLDEGKVLWRYKNPDRQFPYLSSAALAEGLVVVGGRDKLLHAIDAASGEARWTFATRGKVDSSPVIFDKRVFFGSTTGELFALSLGGGDVVWRFDTGSSVVASPAIAHGSLYIGTLDGQLYRFGGK